MFGGLPFPGFEITGGTVGRCRNTRLSAGKVLAGCDEHKN